MHYYSHHLGDYAKDTGHLSLAEHGAYRMLLDHCYSTEAPLPLSPEALFRICRATSKAERQAVKDVLAQFFKRSENGFSSTRADKEIAEFQSKSTKAKNAGILSGIARRTGKTTNERSTDAERTLNERSAGVQQRGVVEPSNNQEPRTSVLLEKEPKKAGVAFCLLEDAGDPKPNTTKATISDCVAGALRVMFSRRETTEWSAKEIAAFRKLRLSDSQALEDLASFAKARAAGWMHHRKDTLTLLNNWQAETERAADYLKSATGPGREPAKSFAQIDREAKETARHGPWEVKLKVLSLDDDTN